jgi:hypothetical protein
LLIHICESNKQLPYTLQNWTCVCVLIFLVTHM